MISETFWFSVSKLPSKQITYPCLNQNKRADHDPIGSFAFRFYNYYSPPEDFKEVEASKYWKDKFDVLEGKYIQLEKDHEALKKQFEIYKKSNR